MEKETPTTEESLLERAQEPARILLVEDNRADARFVEIMLKSSVFDNYEMDWVDSFTDAIIHLQEVSYEIILLDLSLPDSQNEGGDPLITFERMQEYSQHVPVIVMSGDQNENTAIEAVKRGAQDYLVKGEFKTDHLRRCIFYAIERQQLRERYERKAKDLEESNKALKTANRVKSEFLSVMSHEMRTPLNGVIGGLTLLENEESRNEQKNLIKIIDRSAHSLVDLIDDILDFSRGESGKLVVEHNTFLLKHFIDEIWAIFQIQAKEKQIEFNANIEVGVPELITTDKKRLRQVIFNLLSNAMKFTHEGGIEFNIKLGRKEKSLFFEVKDTGIGMDESTQGNIFEPFVQADSSTTRIYGGTGLGLAICKQLTKLLDGNISMNSQLNKGSNFFFTIKNHEPSSQKNLDKLGRPVSALSWGDVEGLAERCPLKILLVEDNVINQKVVITMLERMGYQTEVANDGCEAIEIVKKESTFELILMDVQMPKLDGIETTKRIRQILDKGDGGSENAIFPYIVGVTAFVMPEERITFFDAGMNDCITKPLRLDALHSTIKSAYGVLLNQEMTSK